MILSLFLALALPIFTGFFFFLPAFPAGWRHNWPAALALFAGTGFGLGVASCLFFLWLVLFGSFNKGLILLDVTLFAFSLIVWVAYRRRAHVRSIPDPPAIPGAVRLYRLFGIPVLFLLPSSWLTFVVLSLIHPQGGVDAWGQWNMRARFLFRGGELWARACGSHLANPDYPLLLPGLVARCWSYMGRDGMVGPIVIAMIFTFASAGLLCSSLAILRSPSQGLLAATVLLGTRFFIDFGTYQYADVPIGFFFLATFVLLALHGRLAKQSPLLLAFAGLAAGLAAWTKNEGLLFVGVLVAVRSFFCFRGKGTRGWLFDLAPFLGGLLAPAAVITYFKAALAPPNYIFSPLTVGSVVERLVNPARHALIAKTFFVLFYSNFGLLPFLLGAYALVMGRDKGRADREAVQIGIVVCLMLIGYYFIYVLSPQELALHLGTSVHRLFLQLWPSFLFACFLAIRTPEEAGLMIGQRRDPQQSRERRHFLR